MPRIWRGIILQRYEIPANDETCLRTLARCMLTLYARRPNPESLKKPFVIQLSFLTPPRASVEGGDNACPGIRASKMRYYATSICILSIQIIPPLRGSHPESSTPALHSADATCRVLDYLAATPLPSSRHPVAACFSEREENKTTEIFSPPRAELSAAGEVSTFIWLSGYITPTFFLLTPDLECGWRIYVGDDLSSVISMHGHVWPRHW